MIAPSEFLKYLLIFGVPFNGGGGGGGVTASEVQQFSFNYSPSTGVNDAFVVNLDPAVTTLIDGLIVSMSSGALTNLTAAPTLQVNALAAKDIVLWSGAVAPGDIEPGGSYLFVYDGANDNFQLINPSVSTANAFFVQDNAYNTGIDTGAADAYNVTLLIDPAMPFSPGFYIYLQVGAGNTNTGASTITVNGNADPIVNPDGTPLNPGSLVAGRIYLLVYNNTFNSWILVNPSNPSILANQLAFSDYTRGILGVTDASVAGAGYVGQLISSSNIAVPVLSSTAVNITSINLTAGEWLVLGNMSLTTTGGVQGTTWGWSSQTSATLPSTLFTNGQVVNVPDILTMGRSIPPTRFKLTAPATVYLSAFAIFSAGTTQGTGAISALRTR